MTSESSERSTDRRVVRRKKRLNLSNVSVYTGLFLVVVAIVAVGYRAPQKDSTLANASQGSSVVAAASETLPDGTIGSVDQLLATNIAADIADRAALPIAANVENLSVSLAAEREMVQSDDTRGNKPQIIEAEGAERGVKKHTTKSGETVSQLARLYGISEDTIRWANNLTSDALEPNKTLTILPTSGVLHTVQGGQTVKSIADHYSASATRITQFNNLELTATLTEGTKVVVPGGTLPSSERPGYTAPRTSPVTYGFAQRYGSGFGGSTWYIKTGTSMQSGNRYAFGNCTAYAYDRRVELGKPVGGMWGNASSWAYMASAAGYRVNNTPSVGAVMQNGGGYGHVAIVEQVLSDGSIKVSEMNAYVAGGGFNIVSGRTVPASSVRSYNYIH